jgi:pyruvate ferredoxin oxidoreductase beta subunit
MHPEVYMAQKLRRRISTTSNKAVAEANDYPGPAVINVYTTCQPEHGVPDCNSGRQAKMVVESRVSLFLFTIRGRERGSESA